MRLNVADLSLVTSTDVATEVIEVVAASLNGAAVSNSRIAVLVIAPSVVAKALVKRFVDTGLSPFAISLVDDYLAANAWFAERYPQAQFDAEGRFCTRGPSHKLIP